jgi:hypothetical protein
MNCMQINGVFICEPMQLLQAKLNEAEEKLEIAVEALRGIKNSPHCNYDNRQTGSGQYGIGVVDGHRCAASLARKALEKMGEK